MRPTIPAQRPLFTPEPSHPFAKEIAEVDALLLLHPEWAEAIHADLTRNRRVSAQRGRAGVSGSQVLRMHFLKHRLNLSLRKLVSVVADSLSLREFLGFGIGDKIPSRSTWQGNFVKVRAETWGLLNKQLLQSAEATEVDDGQKVRVDGTVVESNVHPPSDSSLIWDCVRTLTRLMKRGREAWALTFDDRSKAAKKLHRKIYYARRKVQRLPAYEALVAEAELVELEAQQVQRALERVRTASLNDECLRTGLVAELEHYRRLTARVLDQTRRRVLEGERVPAQEKVFSIFEPHTDMIVKSITRPPEFGHKVTFTIGVHFVLDAVIERGNPADVTLAVRQIGRQADLYGRAPRQAAFDGGYTSNANLAEIKALGTVRCAFSKGRGLTAKEMAGSRRTCERLKCFRAGVEGKISWLKRDFGLGRCTWKGWSRFQGYVWSATFSANLSKLARLRLAQLTTSRRAA